jgi:hypothetical protein
LVVHRRAFIGTLAGSLLAAPLAAECRLRISLVNQGNSTATWDALQSIGRRFQQEAAQSLRRTGHNLSEAQSEEFRRLYANEAERARLTLRFVSDAMTSLHARNVGTTTP